MENAVKASEPFRFYTRMYLTGITGLYARSLKELGALMRIVPGSCIYHHTHRFLQQHQYLSPEPPNDFAYWVSNVLGERELGERLYSIDTMQFASISALRDELASTIDGYLNRRRLARSRKTGREEAFYFMKSISFVLPTDHVADDLRSFVEILKKITVDSIYFHIFESRLRLGRGMNDFSNWIGASIGDKALAAEISKLDPYTHTLEELRTILIRLIERKVAG
ncbi:MAG: DUF5752 family protein [Candidatus Omnitrophota bacterium]